MPLIATTTQSLRVSAYFRSHWVYIGTPKARTTPVSSLRSDKTNQGIGGIMQTVQSIIGIFGLLALTFAISENRRAVSFRQAAIGLGLTVVLVALFLKIPQLKVAFAAIGDAVNAVATASRAGTSFVFGYLGGGPLPF